MVREYQLKPIEPVVTPFSMKTKYLTETVLEFGELRFCSCQTSVTMLPIRSAIII